MSFWTLALDTANQATAVALLNENHVLASVTVPSEKSQHAESILEIVDSVLAQAQLDKTALNLIAFGAGPGGFTGLRIACGVSQGMALGLSLPVACVCNLQARAQQLHDLYSGQYQRIGVINDARKNECYCAVYDFTSGRCEAISAPGLLAPDRVPDYVAQHQVDALVGTGFKAYFSDLAWLHESIFLDPNEALDPAWIGHLGYQMHLAGQTVEPELASPLYVRDRVALTIEERLRHEKL